MLQQMCISGPNSNPSKNKADELALSINAPLASSSSTRLFMNEGWPLSGHERVTEAHLLLRPLV